MLLNDKENADENEEVTVIGMNVKYLFVFGNCNVTAFCSLVPSTGLLDPDVYVVLSVNHFQSETTTKAALLVVDVLE